MVEGKNFFLKNGEVSDGYHTFGELYDHRCLLFINLCLMQPEKAAWKDDADTPNWFLLYLELPAGQVSYHVPMSMHTLIYKKITHRPDKAWDGHTSEDVVQRLKRNAETFQV